MKTNLFKPSKSIPTSNVHLGNVQVFLTGFVALINLASCQKDQNKKVMADQNDTSIFPKGGQVSQCILSERQYAFGVKPTCWVNKSC